MASEREQKILESLSQALGDAERREEPYRHWLINNLFPEEILGDLLRLEFPIASLDGVSGKREYHNDTRHYFDQDNIARHSVVADVANACQSPAGVEIFESFFDIELNDTLLRIEYAQDIEGFWLEPHTDLGVKKLTVLIYLDGGEDMHALGTDIYKADKSWAGRSPFAPNAAMAFVPGDNTYHGFEQRSFSGIRRSLILNYVTQDWRDRDQLAFPQAPVSSR